MMLFVLSIHIASLLIWSAALIYFPCLLRQQAADGSPDIQRQTIHMQRTLYAYVMTPSALLTVFAGIWLIFERGFSGGWLPVKLALVLLMVFFHVYCGNRMHLFRSPSQGGMAKSRAALLLLLPATLITAIVTLVSAKPF